jgi:hypothetical protein
MDKTQVLIIDVHYVTPYYPVHRTSQIILGENNHVSNPKRTRAQTAPRYTTLGKGVRDHRHRLDPAVCHCASHWHYAYRPLSVMTLTPPLRKFMLTAHITFAVSWLGAVAAFLVLAITGLTSQDAQMVRSVYLAMDLIARFVIVPLSFAPLFTGPVLSLGTPWGLFRHYWILAKLLITVLSTVIMQVHMRPISLLAVAAAKTTLLSADLHGMQIQMVVASAAAMLALLVEMALAVYKPRGMTQYGWSKQYEQQDTESPKDLQE